MHTLCHKCLQTHLAFTILARFSSVHMCVSLIKFFVSSLSADTLSTFQCGENELRKKNETSSFNCIYNELHRIWRAGEEYILDPG